MRQRTNKQAEFTRRGPNRARSVPLPDPDQVRRPICSFLVSRERAEVVPRLAKNGELVLRGNLSCSYVYNGCHTSFDKLLLAEKRAAHDGRLRGTDVRVTYQYHFDGALSTWPGLYITIVPPVDGPPQWFLSPK